MLLVYLQKVVAFCDHFRAISRKRERKKKLIPFFQAQTRRRYLGYEAVSRPRPNEEEEDKEEYKRSNNNTNAYLWCKISASTSSHPRLL